MGWALVDAEQHEQAIHACPTVDPGTGESILDVLEAEGFAPSALYGGSGRSSSNGTG
ncbi:MAG: hypothetical protein ABSG95_05200 [Solirubrobacteraceae bacterium]|jgi:hypothetical protein